MSYFMETFSVKVGYFKALSLQNYDSLENLYFIYDYKCCGLLKNGIPVPQYFRSDHLEAKMDDRCYSFETGFTTIIFVMKSIRNMRTKNSLLPSSI